jgi:hypothetical protein
MTIRLQEHPSSSGAVQLALEGGDEGGQLP